MQDGLKSDGTADLAMGGERALTKRPLAECCGKEAVQRACDPEC